MEKMTNEGRGKKGLNIIFDQQIPEKYPKICLGENLF
jgi:hypothetical protein